ncbi:hypothetical protein M436DRAFT_67764 [Aureobasidium namibiae CBS 147.97]|uniref:Uncharacterized protein n=1 Tax=Aureobasidium namibiae CBS 147.97 TaxID=1043004 RepID=A0A074X2H2_9PEZI
MTDREERQKIFDQTMARLHVKEQVLAAKVGNLDAEMRQFRKDLAVFHAKRDHVRALVQQHLLEQQHPVAHALNTFGSTQIVGARFPSNQDAQSVAPDLLDHDDEPVASPFALNQDANPIVDDGESLFIPEQPRIHEQTSPQPNALKRRYTFAEAEEIVARRFAAKAVKIMVPEGPLFLPLLFFRLPSLPLLLLLFLALPPQPLPFVFLALIPVAIETTLAVTLSRDDFEVSTLTGTSKTRALFPIGRSRDIFLGTATCNHDHSTDHLHYQHRMLQLLDRFQEWAKKDLQDTNLLMWNLPFDIWTDPIGGPALRYKMTMHDGVDCENYGSEHYISHETMTHVMWNEETEQDFEEVMDAHSRQMAREEQRKRPPTMLLSLLNNTTIDNITAVNQSTKTEDEHGMESENEHNPLPPDPYPRERGRQKYNRRVEEVTLWFMVEQAQDMVVGDVMEDQDGEQKSKSTFKEHMSGMEFEQGE